MAAVATHRVETQKGALQLCRPEATCPEESLLGFPFTGLVIAIGKEAVASAVTDTTRRCRCNDWLPLRRGTVYFFLQEVDRLLIGPRADRMQTIGRRRLHFCSARKHLDRYRCLQPASNLLHVGEQLLLRGHVVNVRKTRHVVARFARPFPADRIIFPLLVPT